MNAIQEKLQKSILSNIEIDLQHEQQFLAVIKLQHTK